MAVILDKFIVFLFCLFALTFLPYSLFIVICVLVAVAVSSLCYYFQSPKIASILLILYFGLCIFEPLFCIFLPLLLYDIFFYQLTNICIAGIIPAIQVFRLNQLILVGLLILIGFIAILMEYRTQRYDTLLQEYKKLRDTSTELNRYLSHKNKVLLENQDYEIHLATLKERNRIAREIHDNVGHMISRSLLQVGALMTICKDEVVRPNLSDLKETLNDAMNSIRESVHDLRDDSIDLHANINSIIQKFPDYKVNLDYDMSEHVSKNVKYCMIMIIKEAFSNVAKHSNADSIDIIAREHPVFYQLLIKDNGTNKKSQLSDGMGLENMKTRVAGLNGNITFDRNDGFKIFISIPKQNGEEENETE